jgi:hypothetical protein
MKVNESEKKVTLQMGGRNSEMVKGPHFFPILVCGLDQRLTGVGSWLWTNLDCQTWSGSRSFKGSHWRPLSMVSFDCTTTLSLIFGGCCRCVFCGTCYKLRSLNASEATRLLCNKLLLNIRIQGSSSPFFNSRSHLSMVF